MHIYISAFSIEKIMKVEELLINLEDNCLNEINIINILQQ